MVKASMKISGSSKGSVVGGCLAQPQAILITLETEQKSFIACAYNEAAGGRLAKYKVYLALQLQNTHSLWESSRASEACMSLALVCLENCQ